MVARELGVSLRTVQRWTARRQRHGPSPLPGTRH
ncbi:helix-turn-helix domain-containing protein [Streptomyces sp. NBC_00091]